MKISQSCLLAHLIKLTYLLPLETRKKSINRQYHLFPFALMFIFLRVHNLNNNDRIRQYASFYAQLDKKIHIFFNYLQNTH